MNSDNKTYKFGNLDFIIDLSKWNPNTINLCATIQRGYESEDFLIYLQKAVGNIVKVYYPHNIVVAEPNVARLRENRPRIDITVKLEKPMTTIEKRKLVADPYDKVTKMCTAISDQIDDIFKGYEAKFSNKPRCGFKTAYNRDIDEADRGQFEAQQDDYYE
jgi:hypothetical protein